MAIDDTILKAYAEVKSRRRSSTPDTSITALQSQDRLVIVGRSTTPIGKGSHQRHVEMTTEDLRKMQQQYEKWFRDAERRISDAREKLHRLCDIPGHAKLPQGHSERSATL